MHLFGQMPLAELTNTAVTRQHEFYPREKTEVFGVSVTGAVDSSVYTWPLLLLCACAEQICAANTLNSRYSGAQAMSAVLLIYLS